MLAALSLGLLATSCGGGGNAIEVGDIHLMGPELPPEQFEKLQGVHRSVNVDRAEDAERIFEALGEGGHVTLPPARRFGQNASACRGTVTAFTGW